MFSLHIIVFLHLRMFTMDYLISIRLPSGYLFDYFSLQYIVSMLYNRLFNQYCLYENNNKVKNREKCQRNITYNITVFYFVEVGALKVSKYKRYNIRDSSFLNIFFIIIMVIVKYFLTPAKFLFISIFNEIFFSDVISFSID